MVLTEPEKMQVERVLDRWSSQPNAAESFSLRLMNVADDVQEYWLRSYANGVLMASELIESEPLSPA